MKILNVMPVAADVYTKTIDDYVRKYLSKDTQFDTVQIQEGALSIESEYEEMRNAPEVVKLCIQGEKDGYDAIFINCFGDPGVRAAREVVQIPVFGGFEPAVLMACGLADKIVIVTVVDNVVPLIERNLRSSGLDRRVTSVRATNIPVLELNDHEKTCKGIAAEAIAAVKEEGAQAIVLGCTGMIDVAEDVKKLLLEQGYDIPVVEAARAAVMTLEMYARLGMKHSLLTYRRPPVK